MAEYKVPQDVLADRQIFGPLTFKGFACLCGSGAISFVVIRLFNDSIWPVPVFVINLLTVAFVFVRVKGMSFRQYLFAQFLFALRPVKRVWIMHAGEVDYTQDLRLVEEKDSSKDELKKTVEGKVTLAQNLDDITRQIDDISNVPIK